jgi:hypothetical protein
MGTDWTRLHDPHNITNTRLPLFIVRHQGARATEVFLIQWMRNSALDRNNDALLHLVAYDLPDPCLSWIARARCGCWLCSHKPCYYAFSVVEDAVSTEGATSPNSR